MISISGRTSIYSKTTVGSLYQPAFANNTPINTSAVGVYSLRKVIPDYTGYACRVQRSQDGYELDIPFDANGNLDETALINFVGNSVNAFSYSEQFDNSYWTKGALTVTANATTDPLGGTTADRIIETASVSPHTMYSPVSGTFFQAGKYYTVSSYLKKGIGSSAPNIVQLGFGITCFPNTARANFNINTGVVENAYGGTATITSAGSGWWRCSFTVLCTTTGFNAANSLIFCNNSGTAGREPSYTGSVNSDVYIWGALLNEGTSPTTYVATTVGPLGFGTVSRWYEQTSKHFENLLNYSEEFNNAYWLKDNITISANVGTTKDPFGGYNANKILETTSNTGHSIYKLGITSTLGLPYTFSCYIKAAERNYSMIQLSDNVSSDIRISVDLVNGTITSPIISGTTWSTTVNSSITKCKDGWYKVSISGIKITSAGSFTVFVNAAIALGTISYAGTTGYGVYIFGAQLNTGMEPTPYIRAVASAVTYSRAVFQATAANQPTLVNYGTILKEGGKPIIVFDGSNDVLSTITVPYWLSNTAYSIFNVIKVNSIKNSNYYLGSNGVANNSAIILGFRNSTTYTIAHFANDADFTTTQQTNTRELFSCFFKNTGSELFKSSNSLGTSTNPTSAVINIGVFSIGASLGQNSYFTGSIQEILIFNKNMLSYRTTIESNINSYYSIY